MEFYRKVFFMIFICTLLSYQAIATEQHDYFKQESIPDFGASSCLNTSTASLIACVSLAAASARVSFFYNSYEHVCRWNCIFLASRSCTTYCTAPWSYYAIRWTFNAALHRPATYSSVNHDHLLRNNFVTDGVIHPAGTGMFSTYYEEQPWVMVTLNGLQRITFVRVFNRRDALGERFHDVAIEVSQQEPSNFVQRGYFIGPALSDQVVEILLDYATLALYVRVRITQGTQNVINIVEIKIFAV